MENDDNQSNDDEEYTVEKILDNYGINHYSTPTITKWKASHAERAIRTIKEHLERYFATSKSRKWIDILDDVIQNYNKTPHTSHGLSPEDVTDKNRDQVYKQLYPHKNLTVVCRLKEGDRVRKIIEKELYEKGYTAKWSEQIFLISSVKQSNGVCYYTIEHLDGTSVPGIFYYYQLNLVSSNANQFEL